jgi:hypothetical protein
MIKELNYKPNKTWNASIIDPLIILDLIAKETRNI